jgi:hypothetical protein
MELASETEGKGTPETNPAAADAVLVGAHVVATDGESASRASFAVLFECPHQLPRVACEGGEIKAAASESGVPSGGAIGSVDDTKLVLKFSSAEHIFPAEVPVEVAADSVGERVGCQSANVGLGLVEGLAVRGNWDYLEAVPRGDVILNFARCDVVWSALRGPRSVEVASNQLELDTRTKIEEAFLEVLK